MRRYKNWHFALIMTVTALCSSYLPSLQADCKSCEAQSKLYINQNDIKIESGKIQVKVNGKYHVAVAIFSDANGLFIPSSYIADNGEGKKNYKPCRPPNWECKKCRNCNEYWAYWCSNCATPISAQ